MDIDKRARELVYNWRTPGGIFHDAATREGVRAFSDAIAALVREAVVEERKRVVDLIHTYQQCSVEGVTIDMTLERTQREKDAAKAGNEVMRCVLTKLETDVMAPMPNARNPSEKGG